MQVHWNDKNAHRVAEFNLQGGPAYLRMRAAPLGVALRDDSAAASSAAIISLSFTPYAKQPLMSKLEPACMWIALCAQHDSSECKTLSSLVFGSNAKHTSTARLTNHQAEH